MSWLRELFNPSLTCQRVGHDPINEFRRGLVAPERTDFFGGVADKVRQERPCCDRCRATLGEWKTVSRSSLDGLSGPESMWDKINSGAGYWDQYGKVYPANEQKDGAS